MMQQLNGPQRGRRSQHHGRNNRPSGAAPSGTNRLGRGNNAETETNPGGNGVDYPPSTPSSPTAPKAGDPNAMESGFFNKYADDQVENNARTKTDHPIDSNNKSVFFCYDVIPTCNSNMT